MKNVVIEMTSWVDVLNIRMEGTEGRIGELQYRTTGNYSMWTTGRKLSEKANEVSAAWNSITKERTYLLSESQKKNRKRIGVNKKSVISQSWEET